MELTFLPAGHILGAAQVHIRIGSHSVHFTGDLGRADDPFMYPPRALGAVGVLVTESTYGNRQHSRVDPEEQLGEIVTRVAKRGGVIMFAAFAVGRAETLMLYLSRLRRRNAIPDIPVYLNSPMAIDASLMYQRHREEHRLKRTPSSSAATRPAARGARSSLPGHVSSASMVRTLRSGPKSSRWKACLPHADSDGLIAWMKAAEAGPRMTYITHGEPEASDALRIRIKRELGWRARVPEHLEQISIEDPR
jgi:metallo-beta-lactamase family protein